MEGLVLRNGIAEAGSPRYFCRSELENRIRYLKRTRCMELFRPPAFDESFSMRHV